MNLILLNYYKSNYLKKILMKILQISPRVPYPLNEGGSIGIFNITKFLSLRGHEIVFFAFTDNATADYSEFEKYCRLITYKKNLRNTIFGAIKNLFTSIPFTYQKYKSGKLWI